MLKYLIYKTITVLPIIFILLFTLYGTVAYAAETVEFTPLTDIPLLDSWNPGETVQVADSASGVFNQLFALSIRIGAMLAVFMFIWGGLNMITARDNAGNITKGKEKMKNAVVGLLMLLATYITLNTINPQLTSLAFLGEETQGLKATQKTVDSQNYIARLYDKIRTTPMEEGTRICSSPTGAPVVNDSVCFDSIEDCVYTYGTTCDFYPEDRIQTKEWCTRQINTTWGTLNSVEVCYPSEQECLDNKLKDVSCNFKYRDNSPGITFTEM